MLLTPLRSAAEHYRRQQRITAKGLLAARAARYGSLQGLLDAFLPYQLAMAEDAQRSTPQMLDEQGIDPAPVAQVVTSQLLGVASDGRPLATLLDYARLRSDFDMIVQTQLADVARQSASLANAVRPQVTRYTRVLNLPSCARCIVLAGREYRSSIAFQRHPRCDCKAVPSNKENAGDLVADQDEAFAFYKPAAELDRMYPHLTVKMRNEAGIFSQEDVFTVAGARAIRDGANLNQVVNARAGMSAADTQVRGRISAKGRKQTRDVYGQQLYVTSEGATKSGVAHKAMRERFSYAEGGKKLKSPRLMPESIYSIANDDFDALRLLKLYGYVV